MIDRPTGFPCQTWLQVHSYIDTWQNIKSHLNMAIAPTTTVTTKIQYCNLLEKVWLSGISELILSLNLDNTTILCCLMQVCCKKGLQLPAEVKLEEYTGQNTMHPSISTPSSEHLPWLITPNLPQKIKVKEQFKYILNFNAMLLVAKARPGPHDLYVTTTKATLCAICSCSFYIIGSLRIIFE